MSAGVNGSVNKGGRPPKEVTDQKRRDLNARQRAYVVWRATPPHMREIKTKQELGEVLGVSHQAMWKWEQDPRVIEAIRFMSLQYASAPDRVNALLDMIYEQALEKRDVRHAEIWLKATGVMGQFGRSADLLEPLADEMEDSISSLSLEELERVRELALAERAEAAAIEIARRASQERA